MACPFVGPSQNARLERLRAQQPKMSRIGVLVIGNADVPLFGSELREGLRELGRIEGQHYLIEFRSAEGQLDRLPELASELVGLKVDVIIALFTPCALAAKQATREIPIVILTGDPLGTGLVASLSRPGGNITGLSQMGAETHGKCVELFRDMLPSKRQVALIANGADPTFAKSFLQQANVAGSSAGSEIGPIVTVRGPEKLEAAFATVIKENAGAVVFQASLPTKRMVDLSLAHRMPSATIIRAFVEIGGLMSYGSDGPAMFKRTATFVHKILRGENPASIPIEQAIKFELAINLKTAKAIGVVVPPALLGRADQVIE
jgi:putative ABC transport system substrate-binding protein